MTICTRIIIALWLIFVATWLITARSAKRSVRPAPWERFGPWIRAAMVVGTIELQRLPAVREFSRDLYIGATAPDPTMRVIGVVLCGAGIAFAIWARIHLGRNWGMPMSLREGHELVTTGPYARVRHPIYTGLLVAMLGSALTEGAAWVIPLVVFCAYFAVSAITEEKMMVAQFPKEYPAYKARTKMLVPFVW